MTGVQPKSLLHPQTQWLFRDGQLTKARSTSVTPGITGDSYQEILQQSLTLQNYGGKIHTEIYVVEFYTIPHLQANICLSPSESWRSKHPNTPSDYAVRNTTETGRNEECLSPPLLPEAGPPTRSRPGEPLKVYLVSIPCSKP